MIPAIRVTDLVVRHGDTVAVNGVSLSVGPGRIVALLGPNGAGKSTLLSVVTTAAAPGSGRVEVFGVDTAVDPVRARTHIGVVFQEQTLDQDLSVERNLWFHARLFGMGRPAARERIDEVLRQFGLADRRRSLVRELSGGLARRVEVARALLHRPRLLVLDEPTSGLDPSVRRALWNDLRVLRADHGLTVLYATHYLQEAEFADEVVIVHSGRIARNGSPAELKAGLTGAAALVVATEDDDAALGQLRVAGFDARMDAAGLAVFCARPERHVAEVARAITVPVRTMSVREPSMDDVYFATTDVVGT
ncbi:ABC transporter ATP-binding protein [Actinokineospora iranica]|uniref:ABC-2 type transport system ATP-binding protein n=1 Tax=Actinokineospora iranica TaxID=1271860 RepID=A0A1G6ME22_9PSEU|nr:ABC transporter ATP-binding protein [Actinokineospora iranica]SDC53753.1 ABC-2 type transport system ATP-binding protein [Actinokineospora iranica]